MQMKLEKRISEELDGIKKLAAFLPNGKANALLNKCNKIGSYAKKGQAMIDAPQGALFPQATHANYDGRTQEDLAALENAKRGSI